MNSLKKSKEIIKEIKIGEKLEKLLDMSNSILEKEISKIEDKYIEVAIPYFVMEFLSEFRKMPKEYQDILKDNHINTIGELINFDEKQFQVICNNEYQKQGYEYFIGILNTLLDTFVQRKKEFAADLKRISEESVCEYCFKYKKETEMHKVEKLFRKKYYIFDFSTLDLKEEVRESCEITSLGLYDKESVILQSYDITSVFDLEVLNKNLAIDFFRAYNFDFSSYTYNILEIFEKLAANVNDYKYDYYKYSYNNYGLLSSRFNNTEYLYNLQKLTKYRRNYLYVIIEREKNKTLEAIANYFDFTKERTRQIESKFLVLTTEFMRNFLQQMLEVNAVLPIQLFNSYPGLKTLIKLNEETSVFNTTLGVIMYERQYDYLLSELSINVKRKISYGDVKKIEQKTHVKLRHFYELYVAKFRTKKFDKVLSRLEKNT